MRAQLSLALALCALPAAAEPPRSACDWLRLAGAEAVLGPDLTYETRVDKAGDGMRLSVCAVLTAGGDSLTLLRRETPGETRPVADLRAGYIREQADLLGTDPGLVPVDLGAAALWDGTMKQLALWSEEGRVLMIFSGFGPEAQARETALAQAILGAGG
ncbi:MAG: hypothetical protein AB7U46_07805 [Paenirhodobacter sp.]|uniref:hypothetical protein n=1 Tax=Paenirhodobacter sp. TaxID=1965326 RepID=UPI003D0F74AF